MRSCMALVSDITAFRSSAGLPKTLLFAQRVKLPCTQRVYSPITVACRWKKPRSSNTGLKSAASACASTPKGVCRCGARSHSWRETMILNAVLCDWIRLTTFKEQDYIKFLNAFNNHAEG